MGQSLSGLVQTPVLELREELDGMSCSTQTREEFVGCLQAQVSLDLRLADGMSLKSHLEVIAAESTYDILVGMDFMQEHCFNSEFDCTQEGHVILHWLLL